MKQHYCMRLGYLVARALVFGGTIFALTFSTFFPREGMAQENCTLLLKKAEEEHRGRNFDAALELTNNCLQNKGLIKAVRIQAYNLLALIYIESGKTEEAKSAINQILKVDCQYQPGPVQEQSEYARLVKEVQAERLCKKSNKKWFWIGGGVLASASIITALVLLDDEDHVPGLPAPPKQP